MTFRTGRRLLVLGALLLAAGCRFDGETRRVEGFLFTVYSMPRALRPGPMRLAVRIQDPDYRIVTDIKVRLAWVGPDGAVRESEMEPGPGRDFRVRVQFDVPGEYRLHWTASLAAGKTLTAESRLVIPGS